MFVPKEKKNPVLKTWLLYGGKFRDGLSHLKIKLGSVYVNSKPKGMVCTSKYTVVYGFSIEPNPLTTPKKYFFRK